MAVQTTNGYVYNLPWLMTRPVGIPTQKETVFSGDFFIEEMSFSNTTDNSIEVTVLDLQATPVAYMDTVRIAARSLFVINGKARWMPGGLTWQASAVGINGFIRGRLRVS